MIPLRPYGPGVAVGLAIGLLVAIAVIVSRRPVAIGVPEGGSGMLVSSVAFGNGGRIPSKYTCDGANINPPLTIVGVPEKTASLVLIVDDPDAPMGTWVHWTVWNISPGATGIDEASVPEGGVQGKTSFGTARYGGPCPPSGMHRYVFTLYALDVRLALAPGTDIRGLTDAIGNHVIAKASLIGLYGRTP